MYKSDRSYVDRVKNKSNMVFYTAISETQAIVGLLSRFSLPKAKFCSYLVKWFKLINERNGD